ncbi:methionine synthase reductase-like [Mercenaria mercenaria]|uniref:methionine synthase reductase-like n=1 Tax=Mercenaria mercenaria TaxID=6596 RepID=UPI00234F6126|nr:methionine synthase reductase-like [Mercenaria mercenaria]XP_045209129.2 methionine synthase reductase-like [Mercenaria mercenaria]
MPTSVANRFLLLYGSQTGQAKAIAEEIAEKAGDQNLHADIHCLSLTEKKFFIEREKCVVIITSTTGDGEPPDTALKFVRRLRKKTLPDDYLSHLNYALLGLGDSNYTNFCNCGKSLDKRLQDLGAKRFYDSGWADDAVGLEVAVEPWLDGLWSALKRFLKLPGAEHGGGDADAIMTENKEMINGDSRLNGSTVIENGNKSRSADTQSVHSISNTIPVLTKDLTNGNNQNNLNNSNSAESSVPVCDINQSDCNNSSSHLEQTSSSEKHTDLLVKTLNGTKDNKSNESSMEEKTEASVKVSLPPLSESTLTVPLLPPPFLKIEYNQEQSIDVCDLPRQNDYDFPSAATPVTMATVSDIKTLTSDTAVKKAIFVELDITGSGINYQPGDAISIICPNDTNEVETLLDRLGVLEQIDSCLKILVIEITKKRNASIPKFVSEVSTLRHIFTTCVDIREPPKKALLRVLVEYTSDDAEKRRLQELCSKQGNEDYARFIREPSLSILDILNNFSSCLPPVDRLIEHLPRLQPRPYSVCCSPLTSPGKISFVFNVVETTAECGRTYFRKGVCTGWLEGMSHSAKRDKQVQDTTEKEIVQGIKQLEVSDIKIPIFGRTNQSFHLPDDVTVPVILIGPGTGVAPFIGYLDHRGSQQEAQAETQFGETWLFYGCRHKDRDYIFREKIEHHVSTATLSNLLVSFSRDEQSADAPRYVQDNLRSHGAEIVSLIEEKGAIVYVCGDAKNMAKDVNQAFIDIFSQCKGISSDEARKLVMKLRLHRQYKEDVWT